MAGGAILKRRRLTPAFFIAPFARPPYGAAA
jgi:hypothetical protein